jgi:two-component system, OmpR family, alkaline phosphatase synthesis response regulator PhoP
MPLVLIVGNEPENLQSLGQTLMDGGYTVQHMVFAEQANQGLDINPDAIIFDMTTGLMGDMVTQFLKETDSENEIVSLAALRQEQLTSFDMSLNIDDFFVWPGRQIEVQVRVRQALWRRAGLDPSHLIRSNDLVIDTANYKVYLGGDHVDLTYKEYELLRFLATNREKVFTREALLNRVWGYDYFGGARTVDVHIRRLRGKIETRSHTYIETVRNVGYRFRSE